MKAVNIRQLKKNPSEALRLAREGVVVVMSRDRPEAVLVHLDKEELLDEPGVRTALAVALFKDGSLSPGRAAKLAGMPLVDFMQHLARLEVAVVEGDAQSLREDLADLDAWLSESS